MAEEKQYLIDIDLGDRGGRIRLRDPDQLEKWADRERSTWEWLITFGNGGAAGNISNHLVSFFNTLQSLSNRIRNGQINERQANDELRNHFVAEPAHYFYSQGEIGQTIFAIREALNEESAALAYSLLANVVAFNPRVPRHFKLLTLATTPSLLSGEARRAASRASYRALVSELQDLAQRQEGKLKAFEEDAEDSIASAKETARDRMRRGIRFYAKARKRGRRKTEAAIKSLQDTEEAYTDYMRLRSAVSYWEGKRDEHRTEEGTRSNVLLRFVRRGALAGLAFFTAIFLVLMEMSGVNSLPFIDLTPNRNEPLPATAFVVVIALFGSVLTGVIWAARIMVRNYQTERHLKIDAEERRIMTMTYLALINEGSAIADEDRLVILNALFRQASDGALRDESPHEVALPALLAKLVDRR